MPMNCAVCFKDYSASTAGIDCGRCHKSVCFCCSVRLLEARFSLDIHKVETAFESMPRGTVASLDDLNCLNREVVYSCPYCRKENILTDKAIIQSYSFRQDVFERKAPYTDYNRISKKKLYTALILKCEFKEINNIDDLSRSIYCEQYLKVKKALTKLHSTTIITRKEKHIAGLEFTSLWINNSFTAKFVADSISTATEIHTERMKQDNSLSKSYLEDRFIANQGLDRFYLDSFSKTYRISNFDI